jgi:hypothetical protein
MRTWALIILLLGPTGEPGPTVEVESSEEDCRMAFKRNGHGGRITVVINGIRYDGKLLYCAWARDGKYEDFVREEATQCEFKRYARTQWHECPSVGCQFGGNPVKVPPGGNCRHCGWTAPGERGADTKAAARMQSARWEREAADEAQRAARRAKRTCDLCGKLFINAKAMGHHRTMKHARKLAKERTP